jgi:hypothetical protein
MNQIDDYMCRIEESNWRYMNHKILILISLFALSCGMILMIHSRSVTDDLRHTLIAEGNISHHGVRYFWKEGFRAFRAVVKSDADSAGRVRPMHWIHHHVPFVLTLLRNRDLFLYDPSVRLYDRVNGCLQTHTYYQLFCVAVMLSSIAWLLSHVTEVKWSGYLFVILASGGGICLPQNIILNHCDSGEIGQMMYISLYLVAILPTMKGVVPSKKREIFSIFALFFAYAMKETSVVLFPAVLCMLLINLITITGNKNRYIFFSVRHMLAHGFCASMLLIFVWMSRSGGYVSQNYEMKTDYVNAAIKAWYFLDLPADLSLMLSVGSVLFMFFLIMACWKPEKHRILVDVSPLLGLVCMFLVLASGFWVVNVPWQQMFGKYFLNTYVFVCALVVLFVVIPAVVLKKESLKFAYWIWIIGAVIFVLRHLPQQYERIDAYYKEHYGYRRTVRTINEDIANIVDDENRDRVRILVVTRRMFPEGPLTFWRKLNREYRFNIARDGAVVSMIRSAERNYFRRYEDAIAVELDSTLVLESEPLSDFVYFIVEPSEDERTLLEESGFRERWSRQVGSPAYLIRRFSKEEQL